MKIEPGPHEFGPHNAKLLVKTFRGGAAARAGHDLVLEVATWRATLDLAAEPSLTLTADARSLRVREGLRGIVALGESDRDSIRQSIDDDVLRGCAIEFRSTWVGANPDGDRLLVRGDLQLAGRSAPLAFDLAAGDDRRLTGSATIRQSSWGMKPFSTLFGTLKVLDDVEIHVDARLDPATEANEGDSQSRV